MSPLPRPRSVTAARRAAVAGAVLLTLVRASGARAQRGAPPPMSHAEMGMGFNQDRAQHHFRLYTEGGAIEVVAKDPADHTTRDEIRMHLRHLARMFADGDFSTPMFVHEPEHVPGTAVLTERRRTIQYRYADVANGGRVNIVTRDSVALAALHDFLRYQITAHRTGDPVRPMRR
ncbi:MAG: hypothetical protein KGL38_01730 [Gemmatimonadota bacterium]|nr:hypothetical protein [Gemmatimonadota bacterium]